MSVRVMSTVWDHADVSGTELLILLAMADYADDDGGNIFPRRKVLAQKCRVSEATIKRSLKSLMARDFISKTTASGGQSPNIYRINVPLIVDNSVNKRGVKLTPGVTVTREGGQMVAGYLYRSIIEPPGDQLSLVECTKNNHKQIAESILAFLNKRTGRKYPINHTNTNLVIARLKDGYSEEQITKVIARKVKDWGESEKMRNYLRPKTLFGATNMANYAGEIVDE